MPPNMGSAIGDLSNDDYVAQVLAREARDSSLKYSAQGMGAYMPKRPAGSAPKPNTRFLRHIIKETDNHNAALKRKEEREARERMQQLRHKTAAARLAGESESRSHRHRDRDSRRDDRDDRHRSHRRRHRSRSASADRARHRKHRRRRDESDDSEEERYRSSRKSRRRRSYSRSRSRSPRDEDSHSRSHRRRHYRRGDPSRSRSRSRSPGTDRRHRRKEDGGRHTSSRLSPVPRASPTPPPAAPSENESDPLEDLVGPLPPKVSDVQPIRSRGRGAYKLSASNIDAHFAADYDPTLDVQLEDDDAAAGSKPTRRPVAGLMTGDDDWELALEALRDRAHWKRRGEDRLREAGFNDAFVEKWKANTASTAATDPDAEGRLEDVRWSKKGEGREWDRGKFVDEDGHIDVKASW
ncbi:hypothetical protein BJX96DRAFT_145939 [Aspergillus floccosus]